MKLIYISNARIPSEKAHSYQILKMCEALSMNSASTLLLHPFRVNTPLMKQVEDIYKYYGLKRNFSIKTLPALDIPILQKISSKLWFYLRHSIYSIAVFITIVATHLRKDFIIYSRDKLSILPILKFKRMLGIKIFYEGHVFPGSHVEKLVKQFKKLDGLIVITEQLKRMYTEAGIPEYKILVAPDGVDLEKFQIRLSKDEARNQLGLPKDKKIIGYTGRFHTLGEEKGIPEAIMAMEFLPDDNVCLCLVGGPLDVVPQYLNLAKEHNVPDEKLIFVDHVPNVEVPIYLKAFDICIIPFPWTQHYAYYTSPLKLFEYMASGRPIVATDLPSIREILTDGVNAILVKPDEPEDLAEGIKKVLKDKVLAERFAQQALIDVEKYSWKKRAEKILKFIEN